MKHIVLCIVLLFTLGEAYPQANGDVTNQQPDYVSIKKEIANVTSNYYYPRLLERYEASDPSLTIVDYRYLYYGYIFQDKYDPNWESKEGRRIERYFKKVKKEERDYDKVIAVVNESLREFPFDLRSMRFLCYLYYEKGDEEMQQRVSEKFLSVVGAIMSTGNGESCESAFHVISPRHEFSILKVFQMELSGEKRQGACNYVTLKENEMGVEGFYFIVPSIGK